MDMRRKIRSQTFADENAVLESLEKAANLSEADRIKIARAGAELVQSIRDNSDPSMMELFLEEYGLSTEEGVALMCLAEALLRVPDVATVDDLIEDKIVPSAWAAHLGQSHSPLINASTWALMLTGKVLDDAGDGITATLRGSIKRLGEPVIRAAVSRAMKEMGRQFVLGETIESAMDRATEMEDRGFTYSYDMLGEAACTDADAHRYQLAYADAISEIAKAAHSDKIHENPGISIKLSALHPRYEPLQKDRIISDLCARVLSLAVHARSAGIGLNIDAEEAARLDLSLDVIEKVLGNSALEGWDGFGVVVQAYSKRAAPLLDWLYDCALRLDRRIMVRLVKGAYWDTEIKLAQVEGLPGFPVFTQKPATDISYLACARKLFEYADRIYPQFATHNAHTVAAMLHMAPDGAAFEFQRLHGMGEALHDTVLKGHGTRCRIYAPVGAHKDLLAYLVRRLLENGANSSFVNQIVDKSVPAEEAAADPFFVLRDAPASRLSSPQDLFAPDRKNSGGFDISNPDVLSDFLAKRDAVRLAPKQEGSQKVINPATEQEIGTVKFLSADQAAKLIDRLSPWSASVDDRAQTLEKAADLYEENWAEFAALLSREAGKTLIDCIGELREAVDFLRYYAAEARRIGAEPLGTFLCISPWNFPLAIFTGQIAAALAAGNAVIAKPAETTNLVARHAVDLLHKAGAPNSALALAPGIGREIGPPLCRHPKLNGVAFTGSTMTGQAINRELAAHENNPVLIAETGGINAMIVDSTALLEQAVRDIVTSAFQSAGQRCSALRVLYVQKDIIEPLKEMLFGAMDALKVGDPCDPTVDVGPLIDASARDKVNAYIRHKASDGKLLKQIEAPTTGFFVGPAVIETKGIKEVEEEIFGPVLHLATFEADQLEDIVQDINRAGYGLTFGLHTRIDGRVQQIIDSVDVGNIYVNRNQIGAVVGSQPFGGHGLSGTGPKAGGPRYLHSFCAAASLQRDQMQMQLPGPTGEQNTYEILPRHTVLCAGPGEENAVRQAEIARQLGCRDVQVLPHVRAADVAEMADLSAVIWWGEDNLKWRKACASRSGEIVKLVTSRDLYIPLTQERTVCIDTTASGGNAELLAANS